MTTGILLIATNKYVQFIEQMLLSIDIHWKHNYRTYLFTDSKQKHQVDFQYKIKSEPWPYPTLRRYEYFLSHERDYNVDYLYYVDIDAKFVQDIKEEVLANLVGVRHCGYFTANSKTLPQETNRNSVFYGYDFQKYFGGGFQGGTKQEYLNMCGWCHIMIESDLRNGIIPRVHDETAVNAYFNHIKQPKELSPDYHYPELTDQNREYFLNLWNGHQFDPKILLLDKDHQKIRA